MYHYNIYEFAEIHFKSANANIPAHKWYIYQLRSRMKYTATEVNQ